MSKDLQYEKSRDTAERFIAERYMSEGFYMHFHRNTELYCVCKGEVNVNVSGESRVLTNGQMAFISSLESHSYEADPRADITYFHIGMRYMAPYVKIYGEKRPARWLTDVPYNTSKIYPIVRTVIRDGPNMTELEKVCYGNLLLSAIVREYGFNEKCSIMRGGHI